MESTPGNQSVFGPSVNDRQAVRQLNSWHLGASDPPPFQPFQTQLRRDGGYFHDTPFPQLAAPQQPAKSLSEFFSAPGYTCAPPPPSTYRSSTAGETLDVEAAEPSESYSELQSIKLLRVRRSNTMDGAPATLLGCSYSLETFSWLSCPDFIALSYVWGTDPPDRIIIINDQKRHVQRNLHSALEYFARIETSSYLWADAICIDQADEEEKAHVVQHMGDIFKRASKVYAWLEPRWNERMGSTGGIIDNLEYFGSLFWQQSGAGPDQKLSQVSLNLSDVFTRCLPVLKQKFSANDPTIGVSGLAYTTFSNNPYWQRIWVLQEAYLARDLWFYYGTKSISARTLSGAFVLLEQWHKYVVSGHETSPALSRQQPSRQLHPSNSPYFPEMYRLIIYTSIYPAEVVSLRVAMANFCIKEFPRGSRATDPRDMIYGLLGFATEREKGLSSPIPCLQHLSTNRPATPEYIKADYTKTVQQTYRDVTRALIAHGFGDLLSWSQRTEKRIPNLPTWVPDFSATIYEPLCSQGQAKPWFPRFSAGASRPVVLYDSDEYDDDILSLLGLTLDKISHVGTLWYPRVSPGYDHNGALGGANMPARSASYQDIGVMLHEIRQYASPGFSFGTETSGHYASADVDEDIACRIACADQLVLNTKLSRAPSDLRSYYKLALDAIGNCLDEDSDDENEIPTQARSYIETMLRWVKKRAFRTEKGYVGLGPGEAQAGDAVVLFPGFSAPYVLRRFQHYRDRVYEVVGECYVDGLMDGEYLGGAQTVEDLYHLI